MFLKTHNVELEMCGGAGLTWSAMQAFKMHVNTRLKTREAGFYDCMKNQHYGDCVWQNLNMCT